MKTAQNTRNQTRRDQVCVLLQSLHTLRNNWCSCSKIKDRHFLPRERTRAFKESVKAPKVRMWQCTQTNESKVRILFLKNCLNSYKSFTYEICVCRFRCASHYVILLFFFLFRKLCKSNYIFEANLDKSPKSNGSFFVSVLENEKPPAPCPATGAAVGAP